MSVSFRDLVKKANDDTEEQKKKKSSFSELVENANSNIANDETAFDASGVNDWFQSVGSTAQKAYDYLSAEGYKKADEGLVTSISDYLSKADDIGHFIRVNKSRFSDYEKTYNEYVNTVNALRTLQESLQSSNKYFSQFDTEDSWKKYDMGWLSDEAEYDEASVSKRKAQYQSNLERLKELDEKTNGGKQDAFSWLWNGVDKQSEQNALIEEYEALKAETTRYEREQKALDDHYQTVTPEFTQGATNRNFTNATMEELLYHDSQFQNYDEKVKNAQFAAGRFDEDGTIYDANGDIVYKPNEYSQAYWANTKDDFYNSVVQDKLGMFLSVSEDDIAEANNRLSAGSGNAYDTWAKLVMEGENNAWKQLSDHEIDTYYYYLNTQGQEAAYQYLEDMTVILTKRATQKRADEISEAGILEQIGLNIASIPMNIVGGAVGLLGDIANAMEGKDYNPYSAAHAWTNDATAIRQDTAKDINNATGNVALPWVGTTFGDVYQSLMSGADSMVGAAIGGNAYGALMGMGASASTMRDMYEKGATMEQMALGGVLSGAFEMFFEKYSIDQLVSIKDTKSFKMLFINALKQGGIEASEEAFTEMANLAANHMIMGSQSDWSTSGETFGERLAAAAKSVAQAGIGGFISGGFSGGLYSGMQGAAYNSKMTEQGVEILAQNGADPLKQLALEMAAEENGLNAKSLTKAANKVNQDTTRRNANKVGRLSDLMGETVQEQDIADVKSELTKAGYSKSVVNQVVKAIRNGESISDMKDAEKIQAVVDNVTGGTASVERQTKLVAARLGIRTKSGVNTEKTTSGGVALRNEVDVKEKVSESKETTQISTGEAVQIDKDNAIAKVEVVDGERVIYYNTNKGVVEAADVAYASENDGLLYESFADMSPAFANAIIKNYDGSTPIQTYINGMREGVILYGAHNFVAVGKDISRDSNFADLSQADQAYALKLGRTYAKETAEAGSNAIKTAIKHAEERAAEAGEDTSAKKVKGGRVSFENGAKAETKSQRRAVQLAKILSKAIGIDIVFYDAATKKEGEKGHGANGYFDKKTNAIHLDLQNSQHDAKTIVFTLSHELVHFVKQWSPAKFNTLANFLMEQYAEHGVSTEKLLANKMAEIGTTDADLAYEEMIADACERMLLDSNAVMKLAQLRQTDRSLFDKIKQHIANLLAKIRGEYKAMNYQPTSEEAKALQKMEDVLDKMHSLFEEAVVEAAQTFQSAKSLNAESVVVSENGTIQLQMKQYQETGRATLLNYLRDQYGNDNANDLIATIDKIYNVMAEIKEDTALSVFGNWQDTEVELDANGHPIFTTSINNGDYELNQDFSRVCKKRRQLNFVLNMLAEDPAFEASNLTKEDFVKINAAIKSHGFEIACALCFVDSKRYRQSEWADSFANTWNDIIGSIKADNKPLSRFNFATKNVNMADDGIQIDETKPVSYRKWENGKAKETRQFKNIHDLLAHDGNNNVRAMARLILENPNLRHEFRGADIIASDGFDMIQRLAPDVRGILDGWGGSSVPKPSSNDAIYDNSILNIDGYNEKKAFAVGGVRMNSFSDFMAHMFFDYAQAFADLSAKKLPMHSYTKELDFARLFGLTGGKVNMSAVAAIRKNATDISKIKRKVDKDAATAYEKSIAGLDISRLAEKLGKDESEITHDDVIQNLDDVDYVWADESIDVKSATLLQTGILYDKLNDGQAAYCYELIREGKIEEALRVAGEENVNRGYAKHLGIIAVGVSKAHILKLLRDPTIRQVIPYHRSGLNPVVAAALNILFYDDFTDVQNTSVFNGEKQVGIDKDGAKVNGKNLKDFNFYDYFGKTIDGVLYDGKATAAKYLEWCEHGVYDESVGDYVYYLSGGGYILASEFHAKGFEVVAKFSEFASEENYYKVIEDFDCYDTITGEHSAQEAVDLFHDGLPSDYKYVLVKALEAEQKVSDDFRDHLDNEGLRDEIMDIVGKNGYKPTIMKQLKPVKPVQPTSDKWSRTHTTEEAKAAYPKLWDVSADESEQRNPTQIAQTTNTYRRIYGYLKEEGFDGTILDASSGLGYGTKAGIEEYGFDVDDIEPYPDKGYNPKYTDYSKLRKKYDVVISSFVLNVLPQDQRDALVAKMGELLKDGGRMFVNVRGKDVENGLSKTGKNIRLDKDEWIETSRGSYQKGFTRDELVAYLEDALGDDYTVKPTSLQSSVAAIVTKDGGIMKQRKVTERSATVATDFVEHIKSIIDTKGGWSTKDVSKFIKKHPELDIFTRLDNLDRRAEADLAALLSTIQDEETLELFSYYLKEEYESRPATSYTSSDMVFGKAVRKRKHEILAAKHGTTIVGVRSGQVVELDYIRDLFSRLNTDKDMVSLAEKVFATAGKLGVNFKFSNTMLDKGEADGQSFGDMVVYRADLYNDYRVSDQYKANVLLHEVIHSCTSYVMSYNAGTTDVNYNGKKSANYEKIANAATRLNRIYVEIVNDPAFAGQYGLKTPSEFVAELSNPEFVALLKKKTLWEEILDWICELFGFRRGNSAYDNARMLVDYILDNPEISEYKSHALKSREAAHKRYGTAFGHTTLEDGQIRYQKKRDPSSYAPTFYSQMGKAIEGIKMDKIGASSVVNFLKGKGIRNDEIKWSGIEAFLEGKKSVTKAELQEFVAGSQLEIVEEMSGSETFVDEDGTRYYSVEDFKESAYVLAEYEGFGRDEVYFEDFGTGIVAYYGSPSEENEFHSAERDENAGRWSQYKLEGGDNYREIVFQMPNSTYSNQAMRAHWGDDAEGVLAHARMQDFETKNGKMLFIEEIQSDWHNAGQKVGYQGDDTSDIVEKLKEIEDQISDVEDEMDAVEKERDAFLGRYWSDNLSDLEYNRETKKFRELEYDLRQKQQRLYEERAAYYRKVHYSAPDAPFRDNYHEYVLKRLIRMAAEEGYDSIGWTPADIQSERWSDKYAEGYRIEYDQDIPKFLRKYGKKWGATVGTTFIKDNDFRRDDMEERLEEIERDIEQYNDELNDDPTEEYADFIRNGLSNLNETAEEIRKQLRGIEVWSMPITDSMQQSVLYEGQPMFQKKQLTNRTILANALESTIDTSTQEGKLALAKLKEYQAIVGKIEELEAERAELSAKAHELRFKKGRTPDETKQMKDIQFEANQAANRINTYDKQLLRLEAMSPIENVLKREKEKVRKRTEQKGREALARYREKGNETIRALLERNRESRRKGVESRNKTEMRNKIKNVVSDLNQYLLNGTKERHVPIELQKAVAEALDVVNMDTVGAEERIKKLQEDLAKAKTPEEAAKISKSIYRLMEQGGNMSARLQALKDGYDKIINSDDPIIANSHDEALSNKIASVVASVGNTALRDMTLEQLEDVYDMYKAVLHTIRTANKAFKAAKGEEISTLGNRVMEEVETVGGSKTRSIKILDGLKKFAWSALKPIYAMEAIGSKTLTELYENVRSGEDTWAVDVSEARDFFRDQAERHGYFKWDNKKQYHFETKRGEKFTLTLEQMMSLYAYSKRNQADLHLELGGFVFDEAIEVVEKKKGIPIKYTVNTAKAHAIGRDTLQSIVDSLSPEQRAFVDEMQAYLSNTMGAKGNEVSLALYDIKLFKEEHYFPLKSAKQFMFEQNEVAGEVRIKNSGFSKETVANANNPIILSNFIDVWSQHVNDMSMYHSFVLPLEDFNRVFNYKTPTSDMFNTESVKMYLQNAYGKQSVDYLRTLLTDLNGGARTDSTTGIINKGIGIFKKAAVFASASVVIQQPSAIARALALIDVKYFAGKPSLRKHSEVWAEVKKYAPVAIIKEMGYFDTNMGMQTTDWITSQEYGGVASKMKALVADGNYRDEILSKAPALADELAWCAIWNAVKRETVHKHKKLVPNSELFMMECGKRFTEIVTKTQVYDSVLSRSGMMRSKDTGMKMATAFMAEPTTSLNMIANAILQGKRGHKGFAAKSIGAVAASMILNSILVSIVYAGRDDDEDKTYVEKYLGTLTEELLDSFNPLTLIPFVKDIVSIAQGYDVERSDMAVITDLFTAWENLSKDNRSVYRKVEDFAGAIGAILGLPIKNIMRDARGIYNTVNSFINGERTTGAGIVNALYESVTGQEKTNGQQLYEAMLNGDKAQIERVEARFDDKKDIETAIREALRKNDPRIKEAAKAAVDGDMEKYTELINKIVNEGRFTKKNIKSAVDTEVGELMPKEDKPDDGGSDKEVSIYEMAYFYSEAVSGDSVMAHAIKEDIIRTAVANGKEREDAENSFYTSFASICRNAYETGDINSSNAVNMLVKYGGKTSEEAESKVQYWEFKLEYPDYDLSESAVTKYYEEVEPAGISVGIYYDYSKKRSKCTGTDDNGDGQTDSGSVKAEVLRVIDSLPISYEQKDVLYYLNGWSQSTIWQAPWH